MCGYVSAATTTGRGRPLDLHLPRKNIPHLPELRVAPVPLQHGLQLLLRQHLRRLAVGRRCRCRCGRHGRNGREDACGRRKGSCRPARPSLRTSGCSSLSWWLWRVVCASCGVNSVARPTGFAGGWRAFLPRLRFPLFSERLAVFCSSCSSASQRSGRVAADAGHGTRPGALGPNGCDALSSPTQAGQTRKGGSDLALCARTDTRDA